VSYWKRLTSSGLIILFIIFTGTVYSNREAVSICREKIRCIEGEYFQIEARDAMEASVLPDADGDLIIVDAAKLRLIFYRNGAAFKNYPVALGKVDTPTPTGEWKIIHKGGNWGGGFGSRWLGINVPWGIYGIHGTDKPGSIGYRSSHGCIRMFNRDVRELYGLVKLGTPVHIKGELPRVASFRKEFRRKQTGKDVLLLQYALRRAGFDPGPADGRYGTGMERAVFKLQFFYGLEPTGTAGLNEQYLVGLR